jgi:acyl carrier protein
MYEYLHESDLRALLSRKLNMDLSGVELEASLNDALGIDSLTGLEVMVHVEEHFDVYFSDEQLSRSSTLANILAVLDETTSRWAS